MIASLAALYCPPNSPDCPKLSREEQEKYPLLNPPVENARDLNNAMAVLHFQVRLHMKYNISEVRLRETAPGLCYFCNGGTDTVVLLRANEDLEVPACRFFTHAECWSMARVLQVMTPP